MRKVRAQPLLHTLKTSTSRSVGFPIILIAQEEGTPSPYRVIEHCSKGEKRGALCIGNAQTGSQLTEDTKVIHVRLRGQNKGNALTVLQRYMDQILQLCAARARSCKAARSLT